MTPRRAGTPRMKTLFVLPDSHFMGGQVDHATRVNLAALRRTISPVHSLTIAIAFLTNRVQSPLTAYPERSH
jgi:hypothetical protein